MPADTTLETPILIIGGGPVGLALANELGMRNVPCLVVEQSNGTTDHPKASALNARSMEFMRRWGIAAEVLEASAPPDFPHTLFFCTSLRGHEIVRVERPHHGGLGPMQDSPERPQRCNQLWLDPILLKRARTWPSVKILHRHRFTRLEQDEHKVTVFVHDLEGEREIRVEALHVVDCSGGHSPCRRQFNIGMSGSDYAGYHVSILLRAPNLWDYHDKGAGALIHFVDPKGSWRNFVALDGRELYRFGINGKEYYDNPGAIDLEYHFQAVAGPGADIPHEFLSVNPWFARNVVADQYTIGRVHLAGDAAHLNHPAAGLGLNTGLGDAVGLGWTLAATLEGWGGPGLLANYETERRAIGVRNVGHANASNDGIAHTAPGPDIAASTQAGEEARKAMRERLQEGQKRKVITDGIALGYRYDSPLICADNSTPPEDSVTTYTASTFPGRRAPHAFLDDGRSTLDLFGQGFVLVDFGAEAQAVGAIQSAFVERDVPMQIQHIGDQDIADLYERKLVLVRPDGHVAWRGNQAPENPSAMVDQIRGA